jgi:NAD(P)-dependent dehydrogenase (short-subunit alcohol dehydrogenase family)
MLRCAQRSGKGGAVVELGLSGKIALVTGASRGIGRAIAEVLAGEGCDVVAVARSADLLDELAATLGRATNRRIVPCVADLRSADGVERAVGAAKAAFGRLDILVNNAGTTKRADFFQLTEADWQEGFALKFFGYVRMTRAAWPLLKATQGAVVNIVGVGGRTPGAEFAIGGSVNSGLLAFTKTMAEVGIKDGVRVNAINPGSIATDRLEGRIKTYAEQQKISADEARRRMPRGMGVARFGQPEEIDAAVAFLVSRRAGYLQGALIDVDGGLTRTI